MNREDGKKIGLTRRDFLRLSAAGAGALALGPSLFLDAGNAEDAFTFAYISDSHLLVTDQGKDHRFARALGKAVKDINAMDPQPDFVLYGGDLAQLGLPEELEMGREFLDELKPPVRMIVGEHDWYYDMGEKWMKLFGDQTYSFDHKGVHFVVLNSVVVENYWSAPGMTQMERMKFMAQLDNPQGRPFTVGEAQRKWLSRDLSRVDRKTPVVVFSHSPLYKVYKNWNFWTDDAEQVQKILSPFEKVTVIHGHTHQVLTNLKDNIAFHGVLSTAWPWPYAPQGTPEETSKMFRADPFNNFDACGWGTVTMLPSGHADKRYNLWDRNPRVVTYQDLAKGRTGGKPPKEFSGPHY